MPETSSHLGLEQECSKIQALQGLLVAVMPDGLLYDTYIPHTSGWSTDEIASYLGELVQNNQRLMRAFQLPRASQMTIENTNGTVVIHELGEQFVVGMLFARQTPLAVVRAFSAHLCQLLNDKIQETQGSDPRETVSNAVRVLRYLKDFAPDPHTAITRIALKTGIPITILNQPQQLSVEQTTKIERAVCDVLGLDELTL